MSQVFYRKFRPQVFGEVIGQDVIKTTLKNAVASGSPAHAYLFTGPRGVGKTSLARIVAKAVNCQKPKNGEPCDECGNCVAVRDGNFLDLIEIDAASHTGVDNIREIIEHVKFSPSSGKYKVIVIDEVHMLSKGAFNALLKTLEEPPAHAVFILATTEITKVPATIVSRTQRFDFKKLSQADMVGHLKTVAKREKIKVSEEVLKAVARAADGGMRDALSLFDQLASFSGDELSLEETEEILGLSSFWSLQLFFGSLQNKDVFSAVKQLRALSDSGKDMLQFCYNFLDYCDMVLGSIILGKRDLGLTREDEAALAEHAKIPQSDLARIIESFLRASQMIKNSPLPHLPLELAAIDSAGGSPSSTEQKKAPAQSQAVEKPAESGGTQGAAKGTSKSEISEISDFLPEINKKWNEFLTRVKDYNHSLISSLKLAILVRSDGHDLVLAFPYRFHKEAVEQRKNRIVLEKVSEEVFGRPLKIVCCLNHEMEEYKNKPKKEKTSGLMNEALKVFGIPGAGIE